MTFAWVIIVCVPVVVITNCWLWVVYSSEHRLREYWHDRALTAERDLAELRGAMGRMRGMS